MTCSRCLFLMCGSMQDAVGTAVLHRKLCWSHSQTHLAGCTCTDRWWAAMWQELLCLISRILSALR
jgi:hypothetical protein